MSDLKWGEWGNIFLAFYLQTYGIFTAHKLAVTACLVKGKNTCQVNQVKYKYAYTVWQLQCKMKTTNVSPAESGGELRKW